MGDEELVVVKVEIRSVRGMRFIPADEVAGIAWLPVRRGSRRRAFGAQPLRVEQIERMWQPHFACMCRLDDRVSALAASLAQSVQTRRTRSFQGGEKALLLRALVSHPEPSNGACE